MNNDFNYRPSQPKSQPNPEQSEETPETTEPQEQTPAPAPHVITSDKKGQSAKKLLACIGVLILLAAAAGSVYYWQHGKVAQLQTAQTNLQDQVAALKTAAHAPSKGDGSASQPRSTATDSNAANLSSSSANNIVTGEPQNKTVGTATVQVLWKTGAQEIWVEYGTVADKLDKATPHDTQGLGEAGTDAKGNPSGYQGFQLTGLQPGETYFYRAVGKINGTTYYGGIVAFQALK